MLVPVFVTPEIGSEKLEVVIKQASKHGLSEGGLLVLQCTAHTAWQTDSMNFTNHESFSIGSSHILHRRGVLVAFPITLLSGLPPAGAVPEGMTVTGGEARCLCWLASCFAVTCLSLQAQAF